ncbi:MAG: terpene cyclase/mutase family protein [bacterium]|nr:terpene cyclase/mutase family protein [bacterium]
MRRRRRPISLLGLCVLTAAVAWGVRAFKVGTPVGAPGPRGGGADERHSQDPAAALLQGSASGTGAAAPSGEQRTGLSRVARGVAHREGGADVEEVEEDEVINAEEVSGAGAAPSDPGVNQDGHTPDRRYSSDERFSALESKGMRRDPVEVSFWWLRAHQAADGRFAAADWSKTCDGQLTPRAPGRDGMGLREYDIGATALALCAYQSAGYTHRGRHPYQKTVANGLRFLKKQQRENGRFGAAEASDLLYNHALATLAILQAYELAGGRFDGDAVRQGVAFLRHARTPGGAWGYGVRPPMNDTSISAWATLALHGARRIDKEHLKRGKPPMFEIPTHELREARTWLDGVTESATGRVGYEGRGGPSYRPRDRDTRFPAARTAAMTSAGTAMRYMLTEKPTRDPVFVKSVARVVEHLPNLDPRVGGADYIHFFFGTMVCFEAGGDAWKRWRQSLEDVILPAQRRKEGSFCEHRGSWDPIGVWGPEGGRVVTTALATMILEHFYRYSHMLSVR